MFRILSFSSAVSLLLSTAAFSADTPALELVISPTRTPTPITKVGSSVTVITAEEIEHSHKHSVLEVLKNVPGVDVTRSGGLGQISRIFMRGTDSNHVLVIIDGVEVNDPSSPDGAFDFATLSVDNIERIEVLRGAQGTLYGSEAIGGVITITTKKGQGTPTVNAQVEAGSFHHYKAAAGSSGTVGNVSYSVQAARLDRQGFTALHPSLGGVEKDGYENTTLSAQLEAALSTQLSAGVALRYTDSEAEYDDSFPLQDAANLGKSKEFSGRANLKATLFDGRWQQEAGVARSNLRRNNQDSFPRTSEGTRTKFDWLHHIALNAHNLLTAGVETKEDSYDNADSFSQSKHSLRNNAVLLQHQFSYGEFAASLGGRVDDNDAFGTETTYRIAPSYLITQTMTRLKASLGTGFKAPSLFELFDGFYGNRSLKPEKSRSMDVGIEQELLGGTLATGVTLFRNDIDDLINANPVTFQAVNVDKATSQGVEFTSRWQPVDALSFSANYTYTDAEDDTTGQALLRRPRHKALLAADYNFTDAARAGVEVSYTGRREDIASVGRIDMPSYTTLNLNGSMNVMENVELYGRVDNLLDKDYQEVYGYNTGGIAAFGGVKVRF